MSAGRSRARIRGAGIVLLGMLLVVGCSGRPEAAEEAEAAPVTAAPEAPEDQSAESPGSAMNEVRVCEAQPRQLAADASLAGRAGPYRLELVATADAARTEGRITLFDMPDELSTLSGTDTPLGGAADVDLGAVGAHPAGEIGSTDPSAPGVLVLERTDDSGRSILLRFGASANRRDTSPFDGAYTVLDVHQVREDGFVGVWRSAAQGPQSRGYFCAWRDEG